jgi:hypothetical protein
MWGGAMDEETRAKMIWHEFRTMGNDLLLLCNNKQTVEKHRGK